jgi:hypothetical protein
MMTFSLAGINMDPKFGAHLGQALTKAQGNIDNIKVLVMPEPTNRFDPNALQVIVYDETENKPIGYISKNDQPLMSQHKPECFISGCPARVIEVGQIWKEGGKGFLYCKILVE